jgi:hypothetical protein
VSWKDKSLGDITMISFRLKFYSGGENMVWAYGHTVLFAFEAEDLLDSVK